jgi:hypothetical protein
VIVPSNTYIATWLAVSAVGAKVVVDRRRPDSTSIPSASPRRSRRAQAIMPVHLYGEPTDMDTIMALAQKRAESGRGRGAGWGAKVRGRLPARWAMPAPTAFPTKNFGAFGDGGLPTMAASPSGCARCATTAAASNT